MKNWRSGESLAVRGGRDEEWGWIKGWRGHAGWEDQEESLDDDDHEDDHGEDDEAADEVGEENDVLDEEYDMVRVKSLKINKIRWKEFEMMLPMMRCLIRLTMRRRKMFPLSSVRFIGFHSTQGCGKKVGEEAERSRIDWLEEASLQSNQPDRHKHKSMFENGYSDVVLFERVFVSGSRELWQLLVITSCN